MASVCISRCVDDARAPVRATYVNLYKWPESDFEFVRSMSSRDRGPQARVVDSISCRQLYLRSYTFSREEEQRGDETSMKCLGRKVDIRDRRGMAGEGARERNSGRAGLRMAKAVKCSALVAVFRRLLSCTTNVDVVH